MNLFAQAVAEVLETDTVALDDDFRAFGGWCSLQGFGLLVMMENDFHAPLSVARFLELRTVRDLYREAFIAFAAEVFGVDIQTLLRRNKARRDPSVGQRQSSAARHGSGRALRCFLSARGYSRFGET